MKNLKCSYIACGNGKWYNHFGKVWHLLQKSNMYPTQLLYDLVREKKAYVQTKT